MNATLANATNLDFNATEFYDDEFMEASNFSELLCLERGTGDAEAWAREAVRLLLSAAILLSNCFIVVAVLRFWAREGLPLGKSAAASFLIVNLATADAFVGLSMVFSWFQDNVCAIFDLMAAHPVSCMTGHVTTQFVDSTSTVTIIVIAIDRVMSVSQAARCRNFLNSRRALIVIAFTWTIGLFLSLTVFMIPGAYTWVKNGGCVLSEIYDDAMLWGTVSIMLLTLFVCYWKIHRVTLQMLRRGSLPAPRRQAGTKAARMLLVIFAWDSCAYFPLLIVTILGLCDVDVSQILKEFAQNLTLLTFLADPFIYAYNNQQTKKAIEDMLTIFRRNVPQDVGRTGRRESFPGTSMRRFRHIISTITNSSSASDEEKANQQSPHIKRNSILRVS